MYKITDEGQTFEIETSGNIIAIFWHDRSEGYFTNDMWFEPYKEASVSLNGKYTKGVLEMIVYPDEDLDKYCSILVKRGYAAELYDALEDFLWGEDV